MTLRGILNCGGNTCKKLSSDKTQGSFVQLSDKIQGCFVIFSKSTIKDQSFLTVISPFLTTDFAS